MYEIKNMSVLILLEICVAWERTLAVFVFTEVVRAKNQVQIIKY